MAALKELFRYLAHVILPISCPACGRLGVAYCPECLQSAAASPLPPFCSECGGPYGVSCCYDSVPCYAAAPHDGDARAFLLALKYRNMRALGGAIGREMARILPSPDAEALIPLPLHSDSERQFNQTELIARGLSSRWGIPTEPGHLRWRLKGGRQTEKRTRKQRMLLPLDSFAASGDLCGRKVALVDDVYTTGGTARAALYALRGAGAKVVAVYLWTRRLSYPEHPAG